MKKLILTSAALVLFSLTSMAQDGGCCAKKSDKKCVTKECSKDANCAKKCESKDAMNCHKEDKACVAKCKGMEGKKEEKAK